MTILFKLGLNCEFITNYTSDDGRVANVNTNFQNNFFSFVSVYVPNIDSERVIFFDKLQQIILKHVINLDNLIVAGDFNCCLNLSDRFPVSTRYDKSVQSFANLLQSCKLVDSWEQSNQ